VEVGGDKGDGTKWDDKNVIAKFNTKTASATPTTPATPATAPAEPVASDDDDGFDWDK